MWLRLLRNHKAVFGNAGSFMKGAVSDAEKVCSFSIEPDNIWFIGRADNCTSWIILNSYSRQIHQASQLVWVYLHCRRHDWHFLSDSRITFLWERILIFIMDLQRNAGQNIPKHSNIPMENNVQWVKLLETLWWMTVSVKIILV